MPQKHHSSITAKEFVLFPAARLCPLAIGSFLQSGKCSLVLCSTPYLQVRIRCIVKFKWMNGTPYQHIPVYRPPTDHQPTTYRPLTDHLPTTYRPPTDHLPTTYWPLTDHLPTTYWPLTDHLPTTFLWCSLFTITKLVYKTCVMACQHIL